MYCLCETLWNYNEFERQRAILRKLENKQFYESTRKLPFFTIASILRVDSGKVLIPIHIQRNQVLPVRHSYDKRFREMQHGEEMLDGQQNIGDLRSTFRWNLS